MSIQDSIFSEFTNLYSLSKTLKFELKPTEITKSHLNFEKDKERAVHYKNIKVLFDQLHRSFINQALTLYSKSDTSYIEFFRIYKEFLRLRKVKKENKIEFDIISKEFDSIKQSLRNKIVESFNLCGENFKMEYNDLFQKEWVLSGKDISKFKPVLKDKGLKVLTEAGILKVLIYLVDAEVLSVQGQLKVDITSGIDFFDGFFTYFGPFNQTRDNLYKADGTSTAIATRIIDQNLVRFCDNILLIESDFKIKENTLKIANLNFYYNKTIFEIDSFNKFVTQAGINDYHGSEHGDQNLGQFNTNFSRYIQDNFGQNKKLQTKELYKIMLSEKTFLFEEETAETCIEILNEIYNKQNEYLPQYVSLYHQIWNNIDNDEFLEKVFIKKDEIAKLSSRFFGGNNWSLLESGIKNAGYGKGPKGQIKLDDFVPLLAIKNAFEGNYVQAKKKKDYVEVELASFKAGDIFKDILLSEGQKESTKLWEVFGFVWRKEFENQVELNINFNNIAKDYLLLNDKYNPLNETKYHLESKEGDHLMKVAQTQSNIAKLWLDSSVSLWHAAKMFEISKVEKKEKKEFYDQYDIDEEFYGIIQYFAQENPLPKKYDKIRNFSTKKAFGEDKYKINFENASLLAGWDINKEDANTSILIKNGKNYELIVMDKKNHKIFDKKKNPDLYSNGDILKMEYKLLPGPNKMLPKVAFADSNRAFFQSIFDKFPSIEVIRVNETFKKEKLVKDDLTVWIAFYQDILNTQKDWKNFDWKFKSPQDYDDVSKFYRDVQLQGYKLKWTSVNNSFLEKVEKEGKIYRFQIKNKDWNINSKGKPNLQTIFWNECFSEINLSNPCYKLNGEAEIFQRPKTDQLVKKLDKKNTLVIANKRYSEDKSFFHIPMTINFGAKEITKFNEYLLEKIDPTKTNRLGIDRGENHLLYYCITSPSGEIIDQGSLNTFNGVDYEVLLNNKQENRKKAKDKWAAIGNIKDLKAGYLSLAIGKIIRLAINNNALIHLENLNYGFKKSRTIKFEKSVYQKFEVALATKLQHVVLKEKQPHELGGSLNGLQLCPPLDITNLDKSSQWGIIKYVPASYTSRICPLTGWHKTRYLKEINEIKSAFNPDSDNCIRINYDLDYKCYTFDDRAGNGIIYAHKGLVRNYYDQKEKDYELRTKEIEGDEIHKKLDTILNSFVFNGEFNQGEMWSNLDEKSWKNLIYYFDLVCNIRVKQKGSNGEKIDRIQSPILCKPSNCIFPGVNKVFEPVFFDTQMTELDKVIKLLGLHYTTLIDQDGSQKQVCPLPKDGDANGSYHIANKD